MSASPSAGGGIVLNSMEVARPLTELYAILTDCNLDGRIDVSDIDQLTTLVATQTYDPTGDFNRDKVVDLEDIRFWLETAAEINGLSTPYGFGDANLNGVFDSSDLVAIFQANEYDDGLKGNSTWSTGDWNGDGDFDSGDLVLAFRSGTYSVTGQAMQAVPEPTVNAIAAISVAIVLCRPSRVLCRRRR